jgi:hypothetical protein
MKYFCSKCGKTTHYGFELPKFCAFCGQSLASHSLSPKTGEQRAKFLNEIRSRKNTDAGEDKIIENDNIFNNLNFKKIKAKYKLDIYQNKGESFGELIDNPQEASEPVVDRSGPPRSKEEILKDFQSEASSLRSE